MKQKVLVVDDEPRNQRIIALTLDDSVEIKVANSGEEALAIFADFIPDLVLLDIMMPGIDGYEVCRRIRQDARLAHTRVILVSGKAMLEERLEGYQCGADDYMTKPFVPEELMAKVKVFLRLTRAERDLENLNHSLSDEVEKRTRQLLDAEGRLITVAKMAALGEMAGGIAHEINTPLGTIRLQAEQLDDLLQDPSINVERARKVSSVITRTVDRIGAIVKSLRTFSRDGVNEKMVDYDLKTVIETTLDLCREKLHYSGIDIRFPKGLPPVSLRCGPVTLSQVFMNLIGNSCDAVGALEEKWLEISVETLPNRAVVMFTDSGNGIPESVRQKMFEPFYTTKELGRGTGLGLSISRGIIDSHGGKIDLDIDHPHTRFVIELPLNGRNG